MFSLPLSQFYRGINVGHSHFKLLFLRRIRFSMLAKLLLPSPYLVSFVELDFFCSANYTM